MRQTLRTGCKYGLLAFVVSAIITTGFHMAGQDPSDVIEAKLTWFSIFTMIILAPVIEEFLFRFIPIKIVQRLTTNKIVRWTAIIGASVWFGSIHGSWEHIFIQGAAGIIFSLAFLKGGYWTSVTAHATVNTIVALILLFFQ